MNKIIKNIFRRLFIILFIATPLLQARGGGDAFAGGLAGGVVGGLVTGAMTRQSSNKTVVVRDSGSSSSGLVTDQISRLEQAVRTDLTKLYELVNELQNKINNLQSRVANLEKNKAE